MSMEKKLAYSDKPWLKSYFIGPFKLKPSMTPYPKINVYKLKELLKKYVKTL